MTWLGKINLNDGTYLWLNNEVKCNIDLSGYKHMVITVNGHENHLVLVQQIYYQSTSITAFVISFIDGATGLYKKNADGQPIKISTPSVYYNANGYAYNYFYQYDLVGIDNNNNSYYAYYRIQGTPTYERFNYLLKLDAQGNVVYDVSLNFTGYFGSMMMNRKYHNDALNDGYLYINSTSTFFCVDPSNGNIRWQISNPYTDSFQICPDSNVMNGPHKKLSKANGSVIWDNSATSAIGYRIYSVDTDGSFYYQINYQSGNAYTLLVKNDGNGNIQWYENSNVLAVTDTSPYSHCLYSWSSNPRKEVQKINSNGSLEHCSQFILTRFFLVIMALLISGTA
jgi:hypothetical protein